MAENGIQKGSMPFNIMKKEDLEKSKSLKKKIEEKIEVIKGKRIRYYNLRFGKTFDSVTFDNEIHFACSREDSIEPSIKLDPDDMILVPEYDIQYYMNNYAVITAEYAGTTVEKESNLRRRKSE